MPSICVLDRLHALRFWAGGSPPSSPPIVNSSSDGFALVRCKDELDALPAGSESKARTVRKSPPAVLHRATSPLMVVARRKLPEGSN